MLGVDFVISALFDTSGFRGAGDCARAMGRVITSDAETSKDELVRRMGRTLTPRTRSQSAKKIVAGVADPGLFFQFLEQLLSQMPACCLFYCATLCCYRFLLRLAFLPCSRLGGLRHMPDLRPIHAHFSLFWFCVRIHRKFTALCSRASFLSLLRHSSFGFRHFI